MWPRGFPPESHLICCILSLLKSSNIRMRYLSKATDISPSNQRSGSDDEKAMLLLLLVGWGVRCKERKMNCCDNINHRRRKRPSMGWHQSDAIRYMTRKRMRDGWMHSALMNYDWSPTSPLLTLSIPIWDIWRGNQRERCPFGRRWSNFDDADRWVHLLLEGQMAACVYEPPMKPLLYPCNIIHGQLFIERGAKSLPWNLEPIFLSRSAFQEQFYLTERWMVGQTPSCHPPRGHPSPQDNASLFWVPFIVFYSWKNKRNADICMTHIVLGERSRSA